MGYQIARREETVVDQGSWRRRFWRALLVLPVVAGLLSAAPAGAKPSGSVTPSAASGCSIAVGGAIGDKWRALGAERGPLGCATGAEQPVSGSSGRTQAFDNGMVVFSPGFLAPGFTYAVYRQDNEATIDIGPAPALSHNSAVYFIYGHDGDHVLGRTGFDPLGNYGIATVPLLSGSGRYTFTPFAASTSGVPAVLTMPSLADGPAACGKRFVVAGLIGQRWREMGAETGKLGCPVEAEHDVPGQRGRAQSFERGELTWSPGQGDRMVVAVWSSTGTLHVQWGPTEPYGYDFFIIRISSPGTPTSQVYVQDSKPAGFAQMTIPAPVGQAQTAIVEGCDGSPGNGSTCNQSWTVPATATVTEDPNASTDISAWATDDPASTFSRLDDRKAALVRATACGMPLEPQTMLATFVGENEGAAIMAHLEMARREGPGFRCPGQLPSVAVANRALLMADIHMTGTSFDGKQPVCSPRPGDYDPFLRGLMVAVYRYWDMLYPAVQQNILHNLMTVTGPHSADDEQAVICGIGLPETENHRLMIESARYLSNQLLFDATHDARYDNGANGMRDFLLRQLQNFAKYDFLEYNSRVYQRYSMGALFNLYDYARDEKLRTAARIVLDYTTTKFAVSSNELRRAGPFRRMPDKSDLINQSYFVGHSDPQTAFFLLWTGLSGDTGKTIPAFWNIESTMASLTTYMPPRAALYRAVDKSHNAYQHTFFHGNRPRLSHSPDDGLPGVEVYANSPSFLITAGGVWLPSGYGNDELWQKFSPPAGYGIPQATSLMPTKNRPGTTETKAAEMIRFDGFSRQDPPGRGNVNTCVQDGFACGAVLQVPQVWDCGNDPAFPSSGSWRFLNLDTDACGHLGLYVAIHANSSSFKPAGTVGFFHTIESSAMPFADFVTKTKAANPGLPDHLEISTPYSFASADGHHYGFILSRGDADGNYKPLVTSADGRAIGDFTTAPLVSGPYLNSPGGHDGLLEITFPECGSKTTLDYRDALNPSVRTDWGSCGQDQAQSQLDQAIHLWNAGSHADGIAHGLNAVAMERELARDNPAAGTTEGSWIYWPVATYLANEGRADEAISLTRETQEIFGKLARNDPGNHDHRHYQGQASLSLGILYWVKGDHDRGTARALDGVNSERQLAAQDPKYLPSLGEWILWPAGPYLGGQQRYDDAVTLNQEALGIFQRLAQTDPANHHYRNNQVRAVMGMAINYWQKGDHNTAAARAVDGVNLDRALANDDPGYLPDLGSWLFWPTIGYVAGIGQKSQAIALAKETVDIYTKLNDADPATYGPRLTDAKNLLKSLQQ